MPSFSFESVGNFEKTDRFLKRMSRDEIFKALDSYGAKGVSALVAATPKDSGEPAMGWSYEIERRGRSYVIHWINHHVNQGVNIAAIIQLGHGTRNGGYVQGIDYINPALRPVFEEIANDVWREVTK